MKYLVAAAGSGCDILGLFTTSLPAKRCQNAVHGTAKQLPWLMYHTGITRLYSFLHISPPPSSCVDGCVAAVLSLGGWNDVILLSICQADHPLTVGNTHVSEYVCMYTCDSHPCIVNGTVRVAKLGRICW